MLQELRITNLALIEELFVDFAKGLVVFTGETGAGKSIILQAIHLLTGGRASTSWLRSGADTCTVEALFEYAPQNPAVLLVNEKGYQSEGAIVIKRVLAKKGKNRFYINGSPATAKMVEEIAENLVSVASQHEHQKLLSVANHLFLLDDVGALYEMRQDYSQNYNRYRELKQEVEKLHSLEREKEQRRDFLAFQSKEIGEAEITVDEDKILNEEKNRLRAADELRGLGRQSTEVLSNEVLDGLRLLGGYFTRMAELDKKASTISEEAADVTYRLEDTVINLQRYLDDIPDDPSRLDVVTERLHLLSSLKRKYGDTLEDVIAFGSRAVEELLQLESMDEKLKELQEELAKAEGAAMDAAMKLSKARKAVALDLENKMGRELSALNFEAARFTIHFHSSEELEAKHLSLTGVDKPEFLFSANPGEKEQPIAKVASGGELSRLLLALKCILAQNDQVSTVIFDEVDAGISGKAASMVAAKIRELAGHHQVLCISHLPQIASLADEHYLVRKKITGERTLTEIEKLSVERRVDELAKMLDGDVVTDQALEYARELLGRNTDRAKQQSLFH